MQLLAVGARIGLVHPTLYEVCPESVRHGLDSVAGIAGREPR